MIRRSKYNPVASWQGDQTVHHVRPGSGLVGVAVVFRPDTQPCGAMTQTCHVLT